VVPQKEKSLTDKISLHDNLIPGLHLKNEDTAYKQNVFDLCNKLGTKKAWKELGLDFKDKKVNFHVIFEDEWQNKINKIFE
jgi:type III restriction enzyme